MEFFTHGINQFTRFIQTSTSRVIPPEEALQIQLTKQEEQFTEALKLRDDKKYMESVVILIELADSKLPDIATKAQLELGKMYCQGHKSDDGDIPKSMTRAIEYFTLAADKGLAEGHVEIGKMYLHGYQSDDGNIPKDTNLAIKYFTLAAENDSATALVELGLIYYNGNNDTEKDEVKGLQYFQQAAKKENADAMYQLGLDCQIKKNENLALTHFEEAAKNGHRDAQNKCLEAWGVDFGKITKTTLTQL